MGRITGKKNMIAFCLAVISAIFLFISGTTGVASWISIEDTVSRYADIPYIDYLFGIVLIIASFGAVAVLIGGILILEEKAFLGSILILFGSGAGLISFLFNLYISIIASDFSLYTYLSFSSLGLLFAVAAQVVSTKIKKSWWYRKLKR